MKPRRILAAVLVVLGALLMLLAPQTLFTGQSGIGAIVILAGVVIEIAGIALERRARRRRD
jgi:drug/metabolite transporter (DMT)-like permease